MNFFPQILNFWTNWQAAGSGSAIRMRIRIQEAYFMRIHGDQDTAHNLSPWNTRTAMPNLRATASNRQKTQNRKQPRYHFADVTINNLWEEIWVPEKWGGSSRGERSRTDCKGERSRDWGTKIKCTRQCLRIRIRDLVLSVIGSGSVSYSNEHKKINWKGKFYKKMSSGWVLADILTMKIKLKLQKVPVLF
jgi:hypothetical protein